MFITVISNKQNLISIDYYIYVLFYHITYEIIYIHRWQRLSLNHFDLKIQYTVHICCTASAERGFRRNNTPANCLLRAISCHHMWAINQSEKCGVVTLRAPANETPPLLCGWLPSGSNYKLRTAWAILSLYWNGCLVCMGSAKN